MAVPSPVLCPLWSLCPAGLEGPWRTPWYLLRPRVPGEAGRALFWAQLEPSRKTAAAMGGGTQQLSCCPGFKMGMHCLRAGWAPTEVGEIQIWLETLSGLTAWRSLSGPAPSSGHRQIGMDLFWGWSLFGSPGPLGTTCAQPGHPGEGTRESEEQEQATPHSACPELGTIRASRHKGR